MGKIEIVPHQALVRRLRLAVGQGQLGRSQFTVHGLAAHVLREQGLVYRQDGFLSLVLLWESIREYRFQFKYFQEVAHFPGFLHDVADAFSHLDMGRITWDMVPVDGREELQRLHRCWHEKLKTAQVFNLPMQLEQAIAACPQSSILRHSDGLVCNLLADLSALEKRFLAAAEQAAGGGCLWESGGAYGPKHPVQFFAAASPVMEVEEIAARVRKFLVAGGSAQDTAVVFFNLPQYLPLVCSVFEKWAIPWTPPPTKIGESFIGRAILNLIRGVLQEWDKPSLARVISDSYGFPLGLTAQDLAELEFAANLQGMHRWRERLGANPNWQSALETLVSLQSLFCEQSLELHAEGILQLLSQFSPDDWPALNLPQQAMLCNAFLSIEQIAQTLRESSQIARIPELLALLEHAFERPLPSVTSYIGRVTITSAPLAVGMDWELLCVGGLTESGLPLERDSGWLRTNSLPSNQEKLLSQVLASGQQVLALYPKTDILGRPTLPTPLLDSQSFAEVPRRSIPFVSTKVMEAKDRGLLGSQQIQARLQEFFAKQTLSVSQLNMYSDCPYRFYAQVILGLDPQEPDEDELTAAQEGSLVHRILHRFWQGQKQQPTVAAAQKDIEVIGQQVLKEATVDSPRILQQMRRFIRKDIEVVGEGFFPRHLEYFFQLSVAANSGTIQLKGVIDRADLSRSGELVIYDYKTGSRPAVNDILTGNDLQLSAYIAAAEEQIGPCVGAAFYGISDNKRTGVWQKEFIQQLGVRANKRSCFASKEWVQVKQELEQLLVDTVEKIFQGQFPVQPQTPRVCSYCPYPGVCRREVPAT